MIKTIFLSFAFVALNCLAFEIPEKFLGEYQAEIDAYKFQHDDDYHRAAAHNIRVILKESEVWYQSGKLTLQGSYKNVVKEGADYFFDINVSNSKSVNFDFNLTINKKTGLVMLKGLKGVPDTRMTKKTDKPAKNRGFGKL